MDYNYSNMSPIIQIVNQKTHWRQYSQWRHTKTIHMTLDTICDLDAWLSKNVPHKNCHINIIATKQTKLTGLYSVVVFLNDANLWPLFQLTWT